MVLNLLVQNLVMELSLDNEQEQKIRELIRPELLAARDVKMNSFLEPYIYSYYGSKVRTDQLKKISVTFSFNSGNCLWLQQTIRPDD